MAKKGPVRVAAEPAALTTTRQGDVTSHDLQIGRSDSDLYYAACSCGRWQALHHPDRDRVIALYREHVERKRQAAARLAAERAARKADEKQAAADRAAAEATEARKQADELKGQGN